MCFRCTIYSPTSTKPTWSTTGCQCVSGVPYILPHPPNLHGPPWAVNVFQVYHIFSHIHQTYMVHHGLSMCFRCTIYSPTSTKPTWSTMGCQCVSGVPYILPHPPNLHGPPRAVNVFHVYHIFSHIHQTYMVHHGLSMCFRWTIYSPTSTKLTWSTICCQCVSGVPYILPHPPNLPGPPRLHQLGRLHTVHQRQGADQMVIQRRLPRGSRVHGHEKGRFKWINHFTVTFYLYHSGSKRYWRLKQFHIAKKECSHCDRNSFYTWEICGWILRCWNYVRYYSINVQQDLSFTSHFNYIYFVRTTLSGHCARSWQFE